MVEPTLMKQEVQSHLISLERNSKYLVRMETVAQKKKHNNNNSGRKNANETK